MKLSIRPMTWDDHGWLHAHAVANFKELAPDLPTPKLEHYDQYWSDPKREPLVLLLHNRRIGFAMLRMRSNARWELAEFYISLPYRRRGYGQSYARLVLCQKPGPWMLGVAKLGVASDFWTATLHDAPWLSNLSQVAPFYPAQSHGYTFATKPSEQENLS